MSLEHTIEEILSDAKGILAADESTGTIGKRFAKNNIESTPATRQQYREMLFSTKGIEQYISAVILFDETIRQKSSSGVPLIDLLSDKGIIPGIKVDKGTTPLPNYPDEKITNGLDGLEQRLLEYRQLGAKFAKWRAVFSIGPSMPSELCIDTNAEVMARYAALCQQADIVPIVEPEVLMDGDHSINTCEEVTTHVLQSVFHHLHKQRVILETTLLKSNMVLAGKDCSTKSTSSQAAQATIRTLRRSVPAAIPAVAFLSGGQSPIEATKNLAAINDTGIQPWKLIFSFSRALQDMALQSWAGREENVSEAQKIFLHRAKCNSAACRGEFIDQTRPQ